MSYNPRVTAIVQAVQKARPLPERFADLDALNRRVVTREAAALGVTPEAHYADIVRKRAERLDSADRAAEIAKMARQYGRR